MTESGIPGFGGRKPRYVYSVDTGNAMRSLFGQDVGDSYTTTFEAFYQPGQYLGSDQGYGGTIRDQWRLFYSLREPVGHWWVVGVANDIWDNWFRVVPVDDPTDEKYDRKVQRALEELRAKVQLPRETVFERRYGTSIFLCSYSNQGSWSEPLVEGNGTKLMQITPYPWTAVTITEIDENETSPRYGHPTQYTITRGSPTPESNTIPWENTATDVLEVHWTKVIHDAPRLDEHPYIGISAIDCIFDDLVGGRNARWGAYQTIYRYGGGFPVVKTTGTAQQNEDWVDSGGLDDYLNTRGYMVMGQDEDFKFAGTEGYALNPTTYFDMYFTFIAAATGVAKDSIAGVSAGRVTGNESNERKYFKAITLQQNKKEPVLRELIDRLQDSRQVPKKEYVIDWIDPFEVNPQDKSAMAFMDTRTLALQTWKTINEIRAEQGLEPIDGGDVLMLLPGQMVPGGSFPAPNQEEPSVTETEPEGEPTESTLLDRVVKK